ncbi:MAG TPA: LuxR C-terminal-related transcriptional regulator [Candidatus Acidoferrales bacterium]|nr:LuxR C-terminal-related transcriptional regulator [Candidatus Acidoferrales bacterium]
MKDQRNHRALRAARSSFQVRPKAFVFFDRTSCTKRFEVTADADGSLPVEQTISLLAMQCVVRGQTPADFRVMVPVEEDLLEGLAPRAKRLIDACLDTVLPVRISQRQQDVLRGVLQNLSNKEIAANLNVAERTIKFHVSALLQKFHVDGRVGLMRKAAEMLSAEKARGDHFPTEPGSVESQPDRPEGAIFHSKLLRLADSDRRVR